MATESLTPIHGAVNHLRRPLGLQVDGKAQPVVASTCRLDLQTEAWRNGWYRSYWECELVHGQHIIVCHDLIQGGWFQVTRQDNE